MRLWRIFRCSVVLVMATSIGVLADVASSWAENPTSGARLFVEIVRPSRYAGGTLPGLILVPGGRGDSSTFLRPTPGGSEAQEIADHGFVVVVFDPDGRGRSEGVEDDNGFVHQDGLAAIIRFAACLPEIDPARLGLVSYSYGVTMAMGALARHPDLPILFYIDWEGPANRSDTGGCDASRRGHLQDHSCTDEEFWSQREASTFALSLAVPYLRLQSRLDHVQPDVEHALLLIANTTAVASGGRGRCPWTRLNDLEPNRVYSDTAPPTFPAKDLNLQVLVGDYALELLDLFQP